MEGHSLFHLASGLTFRNDQLAVRVPYLATCGRSQSRAAAASDKPVPNH